MIVGAGIVGASIAYHLARRGAPVTVIDSNEVAGGATAQSFAWINSWSSANEAYARLRHNALQDYHRLQQDLDGALPLSWSGALIWKAERLCGKSAMTRRRQAVLLSRADFSSLAFVGFIFGQLLVLAVFSSHSTVCKVYMRPIMPSLPL